MIRTARSDDVTPMMRQYFRAKEQHPTEIVLFRMGDFYEVFFDDARKCAELLGITLTSRSKEKSGDPIPMAGVPVKSVDTYIRRLLRAGQRVAICEQVQDPKDAQGIVDREVVRVVTPGTFVDEAALDDQQPLHLAALVVRPLGIGVAWVDLSTGRFHAEDLPPNGRFAELLLAVAPTECLYPEGRPTADVAPLEWLSVHRPRCALTPYPEWHFDHQTGRERLLAHFGTRSLEGFGCEHLGPGLDAAGALIHYLGETQRQALPHIARLATGGASNRLGLDAATHRALDLLSVARTGERRGSLLDHVDRTRTAMGARLIREWVISPLASRDAILRRQDGVAHLVGDLEMLSTLREALGPVRDIERLTSRLTMGRANGRDLRALEGSLRAIPAVRRALASCEARVITEALSELDESPLLEIADRIDRAIVLDPPITVKEGGVIRDGYEPELDELRGISREGVDWIARFQTSEIERTGIPLKVGYNRVFGYFIEITHAHRDRIPVDYTRKQTLKNAERYVTPSLKEQENRVLGAKDRAESLEFELFGQFREDLLVELARLQSAAAALATVDALVSLAHVAREEGYVRPEVVDEPILEVEGGRHPVLSAGAGGADFTPNDVQIGGEHGTLAVITGPNMAGKSTYIRQSALIVLLAQMGSFVPASKAKIGIADRIFTRVGAADDITRGQSTFMVEMTETANILNNATERSLVILDEVGRGTSTLDGVSLAWAIAEHLITPVRARTLFATHYHELTELSERHEGRVQNLNVAVREWQDEIVFLHKIVPGGTDKAYGIHVARLAGIPADVLARARAILGHLEQEHDGGRGTPASVPARSKTPRGSSEQLGLFAPRGEDIIRELETLDPNALTPLEALQRLVEWRKRL